MWKLWLPILDVRLIAIEEVRNYRKFYTLKTFLKMESGKVHISHPGPTPLDPPLTISYRNHQKSLAYFSHLAPLVLFFFIKRQSQKKDEVWHNASSLNALLPRSLRLGACEQIISSFKGGLHVYKRRSAYCVLCWLEESLSSSSCLHVTFTEFKCMVRLTYVAIARRGSGWRSSQTLVW